jgi:hypothetical protein
MKTQPDIRKVKASGSPRNYLIGWFILDAGNSRDAGVMADKWIEKNMRKEKAQ